MHDVKQHLNVHTFDQLYLIFRDSPAINRHFHLEWDHKILYCPKPELTHIQTDQDYQKSYTVADIDDTDSEFPIFHKLVHMVTAQWAKTESAKMHNKWQLWKQWECNGLRDIQSAKQIKHIMKITNIHEYVAQMQVYPPFLKHFTVIGEANSITYRYIDSNVWKPIGMTSINELETAFNQLTADFNHQHHDYEIKMHTFKASCDDLQLKLDACEHTVKHHFTMYKQNLQRINTTIINESIEQMKINITTLISDKMLEFESKLNVLVDDMIQDIYVASEEANKTMFANSEYILTNFTNKMTTESDQMLQHLHRRLQAEYDASRQKLDDVHNKVQHFKQSSTMPDTHTNRFPNVKLDTTFRRSPNPFESSASLPGSTFRRSPTATFSNQNRTEDLNQPPYYNSGMDIPSMVDLNKPTKFYCDPPSEANAALPPLNHDHALKRAKIQFTGLGDMFVFYNQLLNGMEQFRCLLNPTPLSDLPNEPLPKLLQQHCHI
jgi:hypothetical protein